MKQAQLKVAKLCFVLAGVSAVCAAGLAVAQTAYPNQYCFRTPAPPTQVNAVALPRYTTSASRWLRRLVKPRSHIIIASPVRHLLVGRQTGVAAATETSSSAPAGPAMGRAECADHSQSVLRPTQRTAHAPTSMAVRTIVDDDARKRESESG